MQRIVVVALAVLVPGCASRSNTPSAPAIPRPASAEPAAEGTPAAQGTPAQGTPSAQPAKQPGESPATTSVTETEAGASHSTPSAATAEERKADLDGKLDKSVAEFDALLMREQAALAQHKAEAARAAAAAGAGSGSGSGSGGGGGAAGGKGSYGKGAETGEGEKDGEGGKEGEGDKEGGSGSARTADAGKERGGQQAGREGGSGKDQSTGSTRSGGARGGREVEETPEGAAPTEGRDDRTPGDVGDGEDDDVVARQLREAAQQEEDPVLREKLWDEYREYKRTSGGSR